jgi:hypothetical protein
MGRHLPPQSRLTQHANDSGASVPILLEVDQEFGELAAARSAQKSRTRAALEVGQPQHVKDLRPGHRPYTLEALTEDLLELRQRLHWSTLLERPTDAS